MSALSPLRFHYRNTAGSGLFLPARCADRGAGVSASGPHSSPLNLGRVGAVCAARPLFWEGVN